MLRVTDQAALAKEVTRIQETDDSLPTGLGDRCEFDRPAPYVINSVCSVPLAKDRLPRPKIECQSAWNRGGQILADAEEVLLFSFRLHIAFTLRIRCITPYI